MAEKLARLGKTKLADQDGRKVVDQSLIIKGAGDRLSKALTVDPQNMKPGEVRYVLVRCMVRPPAFDFADPKHPDTSDLVRVERLHAESATFMDSKVAAKAIADQDERIRLAAEKAAGVERLPMGTSSKNGSKSDDNVRSLAEQS